MIGLSLSSFCLSLLSPLELRNITFVMTCDASERAVLAQQAARSSSAAAPSLLRPHHARVVRHDDAFLEPI